MWSVLKVGGGAQPLSKKQFFSVNCQTVNCPPDLITQFRQFDFSNYRCLPQQDLTLEGDQDESTFLTFRFMLRICNNQTDGGICKSIDVIQKKLQDKFFYLNFPDITVDVDDYEHPFIENSRSRIVAVSTTQTQYLHINLQQVNFSSDTSPLFNDPKKTSISNLVSSQLMSMPITAGTLSQYNSLNYPLVNIYFTSSKDVLSISRRYMKIQEVLANAAGVANFLLVIGWILTSLHSNLTLMSHVFNNLYSFKNEDSAKGHLSNTTYKDVGDLSPTNSPLADLRSLEPTKLLDTKDQNQPSKEITAFGERKKDENNPMKLLHKNPQYFEITKIKNDQHRQTEEIIPEERIRIEQAEIVIPVEGVVQENDENKCVSENPETKKIKIELSLTKNISEVNEKLTNFQNYLRSKKHKKHLNFNTLTYVKAKFNLMTRRNLSKNQKDIIQAENLFPQETDIINIMIKLQEIDKLKYLLLSDEQISLFKLIEKPVLLCDGQQYEENNALIQMSGISMNCKNDKRNEELNSYKILLENQSKSEVDQRILKLLEDQVKL